MLEKLKINKNYIMPLTSLVVVGTVMVLSVAMLLNSSLGWLASNDEVTAGGMGVGVRGMPDVDVYLELDGVRLAEDATDIFSGLVPGQKVAVKLYAENKTDEAVRFALSMAAPTAEDDTPVIEDGLYHYFGSQIRLNSIKQGESEQLTLTGIDRYLLTLDAELYTDGLQPTAIDAELDFSTLGAKALTGDIEIAAGGTLVLDLELEFVDNNKLQNPYIKFGDPTDEEKKNLVLKRTLICTLSYVE